MSSRPHSFLISEIEELEQFLDRLPMGADIERYALEKRLENKRHELASLPVEEQFPESIRLTFRGAPVASSHGISADFAGKASNAFADAFSATLAGINDTLKYMGPIPNKTRYPLLITGIAIGSFGFEIELPLDRDLFEDRAGAGVAVEKIKNVFRISAEGTDDEVAEAIDGLHPRAVSKIADFLDVLRQNNAWCGIEFREDFFKYKNIEQLEKSESRLREENINRSEMSYFGEFQGILPQGRTFEFKVADEESIIKGRLDQEIEDPDILNREWLHEPLYATFYVVQVGNGRPRYTLQSLDKIKRSRKPAS